MRIVGRFGLLLAGSLAASPVQAQTALMTGTEIRQAVAGKTLDGVYPDGLAFTESYASDGKIDYRETNRPLTGRWTIEGPVFCTLYDGGNGGGCWRLRATGANCFTFFNAAKPKAGAKTAGAVGREWGAMAWRQGEPSTCEGRPTV